MVMNAVSISNKSDNAGLYGRKILSRVRNTDTLKCTKEQISNARVIGQFNNEFIIIKNEHNVFIIDQHAIHERIRLEKYVSIATIKGTNYDLEALKEKACKGAIKFKDRLNIYKMKEMVRWYRYLKYPFICCHGRPTIVYIGRIQE
ncbi:putative MutL,  dimerization, DNA mismatch repair protein [Trachipleistophora hominis]|uniref:Putative MutL, dimerization, DNA mismatch repair protein n=1 Tax=Trachipleistophora hominis TaxID=72359 RepID=L7JZN4_TRAHO|nr:putative MutL,  dimerization, DNA mismatch repair protein [Trachipleistophora hominis]